MTKKKKTSTQPNLERLKKLSELESKRTACLSIFYYIKDHLSRSDDDVIRQFAEEKAQEMKAQADAFKVLIDET